MPRKIVKAKKVVVGRKPRSKKTGRFTRMFSPVRQYGAQEPLVDYPDDDEETDQRGFYDRYISPVMSYVSPKAKVAYQYTKTGIRTTGRGLKVARDSIAKNAKRLGHATKWTYQNVMTPTGRFSRDYLISPTLGAAPHVGRFIRDYAISPTYRGAKKLGRAVASKTHEHVIKPTGRGIAKGADKFHRFMMDDADPEYFYCTTPYNRTTATTAERVKSCQKGGRSHGKFLGSRWGGRQPCVESCHM